MSNEKYTFTDDPKGLGLYVQLKGPQEYLPPLTMEQIRPMVDNLFNYMEANPDSFVSRFYAKYPFGSPPFSNPFDK